MSKYDKLVYNPKKKKYVDAAKEAEADRKARDAKKAALAKMKKERTEKEGVLDREVRDSIVKRLNESKTPEDIKKNETALKKFNIAFDKKGK